MWVDTLDRLPDFGRWVLVWGAYCMDDLPAPKAYRRREAGSADGWFWSSTEFRGTAGISHWWDGRCRPPKGVALAAFHAPDPIGEAILGGRTLSQAAEDAGG